jgi:hypothetical protein
MSARTIWTAGIAAGVMLVAVAAFAGVSAMRSTEARPPIPKYGSIFQSGALVGWASGARIAAHDRSLVEFDQIEHARQLAQQSDFEYGGLKLRISQVLQVDYVHGRNAAPAGGAARPDKTLVRVTARIQSSH